jgi:hypothetical protein
MSEKNATPGPESAPIGRLRELVEQAVQRSIASGKVEPGLVIARSVQMPQTGGKPDPQAIAEQAAREVSAQFRGLSVKPFVARAQGTDAQQASPIDTIRIFIGLILT